MNIQDIQAIQKHNKIIYAYTHPNYDKHKGYVKVGETVQEVEQRIKEQNHTSDVDTRLEWTHPAIDTKGRPFNDHDVHDYFQRFGHIDRIPGTEWFKDNGDPRHLENLFLEFIGGSRPQALKTNTQYTLRPEQARAVENTIDYMTTEKGIENPKYLWNAKPRFGKTLTTYDLIRQVDAHKVLIVTNRPAISTSWFSDFSKFIAWQTEYAFVSETQALKDTAALSYKEYTENLNSLMPKKDMIAFLSLQDLKGSIYFGGEYDKLSWVKDTSWDLLVLDEAHEAVDTLRSDVAFDNIKRPFTLYLSGTPFNAIANNDFSDNMFTWSYTDEQRAKFAIEHENKQKILNGDIELTPNPYEDLPMLNMYTYAMGDAISNKVTTGISENGEDLSYTFDLSEFFSVKNGRFIHEEAVVRWLNTLTENKNYPFSSDTLRKELKHTFWMLDRVASANALARLLKDHPVFSKYKVVVAAGKSSDEEDEDLRKISNSFDKVREAIKENEYTITLSVGQLTTGVTVPEWTAVLMLANISSPSLYMQTAFRVQNPWHYTVNGNTMRKDNAYMFDFSPARSLKLVTDFAIGLSTQTSRPENVSLDNWNNSKVQELVNFLPVIAEDSEGIMRQVSVPEMFSMPAKIMAKTVATQGFNSDLLFNINGVFSSQAEDILNRMNTMDNGKLVGITDDIPETDVDLDDNGDVIVEDTEIVLAANEHLGNKVYKDVSDVLMDKIKDVGITEVGSVNKAVKEHITKGVVEAAKGNGLTVAQSKKAINNGISKLVQYVEKEKASSAITEKVILNEKQQAVNKAFATGANVDEVRKEYDNKLENARKETVKKIEKEITDKVKEASETAIETVIKASKEREIKEKENSMKGKLKGFATSIPLFLLGYGDRKTTLANFESYVDKDVFFEITNITVEDFTALKRENVFNEYVFNDAIQAFFDKEEVVARYFE